MNKIRITAIRKADYKDLQLIYENPMEHACEIKEGDVFYSVDAQCPEGFCQSAWEIMEHYVIDLANGRGNFFDGWMKNPMSAMICCDDGFRPISFLLEVVK